MRKLWFIFIVVLVLAASCSQDVTQVYTTAIENNSPYPIYWGVRRATDPESSVLKKMMPYCRQYILIKESGDYYMDFAQYDSNGEILNEGSFSIENPLNVETIVFSGNMNTIVWKITYKN